MVRFPRIGNRGSKIALYTGFTTLIAINGYIAVKALAGDPVSMSSLCVFVLDCFLCSEPFFSFLRRHYRAIHYCSFFSCHDSILTGI